MKTNINFKLKAFSRRNMQVTSLAAASAVALLLAGCPSSPSTSNIPTVIEANIGTLVTQIGGATQAVALYTDGTTKDWTLYSMANRFAATPVGMAKGVITEIKVPGYIEHIAVVKGYAGKDYALLSMGGKGIGVVDITNPAAMVYVRTMTVDYDTPSYTYSDGGGTIFTEPAASHTSGPVNDLLVYDELGTPNDPTDDQLFIANTAFGIQKTKLSNLMTPTVNGALTIDGAQQWTLKYSGENPWGGPLSLMMHGGKLYAALGFLGIGIYNPATLASTGAYNLYADCTNTAQEDWFGYPGRKISCPNSTLAATNSVVSGGVDADGMPTYLQAAQELGNKSGGGWYPWAEFDRYGKYYYNALTMDVVDIPTGGGGPTRTIAYIAYAMGGLVAVDVTNATATTKPIYLGYVPASPAHGPDEPTGSGGSGSGGSGSGGSGGSGSNSILSYHGAGMLKDSGVIDVRVVDESGTGAGPYRAYYTDHFAGLVVLSGADDPAANWKNPGPAYNNDTNPATFWPDYEFVTSYDMMPVLVGDEAVPKFLTADASGNYTAPVMLATGELNGHGGELFMMPMAASGVPGIGRNTAGSGQVDVVESSGAGGVNFVDIIDLINVNPVGGVAGRFADPVILVSTDESGADANGAAGQMIAIGHAEGLAVSGNFLYLADGPHGMSVWNIANDNVHLVANTLQSEYPATDSSGNLIYPAPHAFGVAFGNDPTKAFVLNQSVGLRKVNVSAVTGGTAKVGAPSLLKVLPTDIYEHSTESGGNLGGINGQDHAYGVAFYGNYAIVADGSNGLTVYDVTAPADMSGTHIVANLGGTTTGQAPLGRAAAVKLWTNPANGRIYAVVAAGSSGISVVDMTDLLINGITTPGMRLIKTFEPMKSDADNLFGSADGKSVDVQIVGDYAFVSYDSFGIVAYTMASLIQPVAETVPPVVPAGQAADACAYVTDVTKLSPNKKNSSGFECRPTAVARYKLQADPLHTEYAGVAGGAQHMTAQFFPVAYRDASGQVIFGHPKLLLYVGYAEAGVIKLDWTDPAHPKLLDIKEVIGGASGTAINNGRVYVAAGAGGITVLK